MHFCKFFFNVLKIKKEVMIVKNYCDPGKMEFYIDPSPLLLEANEEDL